MLLMRGKLGRWAEFILLEKQHFEVQKGREQLLPLGQSVSSRASRATSTLTSLIPFQSFLEDANETRYRKFSQFVHVIMNTNKNPLRAVITLVLLFGLSITARGASESRWLWKGPHPGSSVVCTTLQRTICADTPPPYTTCPIAPFPFAKFSVLAPDSELIGIFETGDTGFLSIGLKPGTYLIAPNVLLYPNPLPLFQAFTIDVQPRGFTRFTITYEYRGA